MVAEKSGPEIWTKINADLQYEKIQKYIHEIIIWVAQEEKENHFYLLYIKVIKLFISCIHIN